MNKPVFDPSKPFQSLDDGSMVNPSAKPQFNPNAPYQPADSPQDDINSIFGNPKNAAMARNVRMAMGDPRAEAAVTSDPVLNAKAMPAALGAAGAYVLPFGGGTAGTAIGQGMRDAMLKTMGKSEEIPGVGRHAIELGTAGAGDIISGVAQKAMAVKDIADAEKAAGLSQVNPGDPASSFRTAVKYLKNLNANPNLTPEQAKVAQPVLKSIWGSGWFQKPANSSYLPLLTEASGNVSQSLNSIPGRGEAAADMSRVMTMPNIYSKVASTIKKIPWWAKAEALGKALGGF